MANCQSEGSHHPAKWLYTSSVPFFHTHSLPGLNISYPGSTLTQYLQISPVRKLLKVGDLSLWFPQGLTFYLVLGGQWAVQEVC